MKKWFTIRHNFFWFTILVIGILGFAVFLERNLNLKPCPLCELQRIAMAAAGFFAFFGLLHKAKRKGIYVYSYIMIGFCTIGALLAARQIYVQAFPPSNTGVNTCGMGIDMLFKLRPFFDALMIAIQGSGSCAEVTWRLLGLTIPEWTLITFIVLGLFAFTQIRRARHLK